MIYENIECDLCGEEFDDKELQLEHRAALHTIKSKTLSILKKKIKRKERFWLHKPVQCEICGFIAKGNSSWQRHINAKHVATQVFKECQDNPETVSNIIVTDFENSLKPGGERARTKAIHLLIQTNSYIKQGSVEPFSTNDLKDLIVETGISQNKTINLMMKFKTKWGVEMAETDFRKKLVKILKNNAHLKDRSHTLQQQTNTKTGREKKCEVCEKLFSCGFTLSRHMRMHTGHK